MGTLAGFAETTIVAQQRRCEFIQEGKGQLSSWQQLKNKIFPGDDDFVNNMQDKINLALAPALRLPRCPGLLASG